MSRSFRLGLRVANVTAAKAFYLGLGFHEVGQVPDPDGRPVMAILDNDTVTLLIDALEGMPFPDTERERQIQHGPRGLGVAIGLQVADLEATYRYCLAAGCRITCEPMDEAWGDRLFECLDPFGYQWELFHPNPTMTPTDGLAAVRTAWFADTNDVDGAR